MVKARTCSAQALVFVAAAGFLSVPPYVEAASNSRPEITAPARGVPSCAGPIELVGRERQARRGRRREHARWSYSVAGSKFHRVRGSATGTEMYSPSNYDRLTDTSTLPSGEVKLRLRLGRGARARTASSHFVNDLPPLLSAVQALTRGSPNEIELSADAGDPENLAVRLTWYLGDGTVATGPTVTHVFADGDYVVMVLATDARGCRTLHVVHLHVPQTVATTTLSAVGWCDPLSSSVSSTGMSRHKWQAPEFAGGMGLGDPNAPAAPQMLGRRNTGDYFGFLFEAEMKVYGNPTDCVTDQSTRATYHWEKNGGATDVRYVFPKPAGLYGDRWGFDGYSERHAPRLRQVEPSPTADGTATISWIDFPAVAIKEVGATNAQVNAEFIDRVTGAESPLSHGTLEPVEGAPGDETAHIQFRVCAAWKPPPDRTDESFKLIKQAGPDAPEPPEVSQRVGENAWEETEHPVLRKSEIGGCGQKH